MIETTDLIALPVPNACQRPEIELLLLCSRVQLTPVQRNRLQQLVEQPLDWPYLLERAKYHKVLLLLTPHLQALHPSRIPPEVLASLQANFEENFQRNLRLLVELLKLVRLFEAQGIPLLAFKGPVLAQVVYGNLALREFVDLDILVPEAYAMQASQLLQNSHYQPQFTLAARQHAIYVKLRYGHVFWHEEKQVNVDLHWAVLPKYYSFTPNTDLLWQGSIRMPFAAQSVPTFAPEYLLLFLCAHGAKHQWSQLHWVCDVAELLRTQTTLNWTLIQERAGQLGTQKMLWLGLYLAHHLLGTKLPTAIENHLNADSSLPKLATQVYAGLVQCEADTPMLTPSRSIYLQTMSSFRDQVWFWLGQIPGKSRFVLPLK
jgi:hypothetical protein